MTKQFILSATLVITAFSSLWAQKATETKEILKDANNKDIKSGWTRTATFGVDVASLSLVNPRLGAGDNAFKFGGIVNYAADYKKDEILWRNLLNAQLGFQKIGNQDFTKAIDAVQLNSKFGYAFVENKWYAAVLGDVQTQILPTYGKNLLQADSVNKTPNAKFFAPAYVKIAPGVAYQAKKGKNEFVLLYSPISSKGVIVADSNLAKITTDNKIGVFANKLGKKFTYLLGSQLQADFSTKFFDDKIAYRGILDLYSNYLLNPQNIDVEFYNTFDFTIYKGLTLNLKSDLFYDDEIAVFKGGDLNKPTKNIFLRNTLSLAYRTQF